MSDRISTTLLHFTWQLIGAALVATLLPAVLGARDQAADAAEVSMPCLQTTQILDLAHYLASASGAPDSYSRVVKAAFDSPQANAIKITAFEENPSFVYAVAGVHSLEGTTPVGRPATQRYRWIRRLVILNPSIFIVDDENIKPSSVGMNAGCLISETAPRVNGRYARIVESSGSISSEILLPMHATYQFTQPNKGLEAEGYRLETTLQNDRAGARYVHVLRTGNVPQASGALQSQSFTATGEWKLTATAGGRTYRLTLPPPSAGAGEIMVTTANGKTLIADRPFPSGILPHGPEGNRLLDVWDTDYRQTTPARWDIGRPADELQKVVTEAKVGRCRVVDMCCGSGSDAIYLASKGFDVTAIDVAPTAMGQAQQKGRKAGISVQWLLADILAPPDLLPFDFVYDRGCYHVVRDQNLPAYMETVRRFSRPGTQFLLLASRRDEQSREETSGVSEEELRFDFLSLFDMEWLREIRLESNRPGIGPPGWSAFLKRNTSP